MERAKRFLAPASLLVLAACTEQDAAGFERAVDGFFVSILQFFLVMMLIAAFFFVMWALIFAGAATAVIAGIRRLRAGRDEQVPPPATTASSPAPDGTPEAPVARPTTQQRSEPDLLGVGMIIFGVVLLLAAAPAVFTINLGPTSAGSTTIPMPLILGGAALVWYALKRKKPTPPEHRPDETADREQR